MAKPRGPLAKWLLRRVGYPLEAAFVFGIAGLFRALPLDAASALGGRIGRTVGPFLPGSRTARRNLERAFPEKPRAEIDAILRGMWDNLGRVIAEYPHLDEIGGFGPGGRVEVIGAEHIDALREDGKAGILVSGHFANWEVQSVTSRKMGVELAGVYRAPNNPYVGALLIDLRSAAGGTHIPKGAEGARTLLRVLSKGGHVGMLIDQKMNDGIPVPFFGRDAMTAPAAAQLALRLGIPLVPARTERLGGARFRITVLPPVEPPATGDRNADVRILMERLNHLLEQWIRERPAEWLWVHRRWPN
ncbi:lipid A biosynthesis lauroyl acyltransferase [Azospirillum rugosum]|uniref:KDO2-lipid IV(A) lauroyltransferase n=1 Tax=Azospirillum rugosum TaxID=416170 RepID=A0ABS4STY9_9PROT|nr:lipid A biosynthesis lauroyl acyltransferase [Azospirillum rugosum]MBP2294850.1 KDO2-lipid IV(A) lauroyltransferase [Azospirillum rugosum]MDQ0528228.1 KDO2-lipid IV(A) lauroyltransferase [Azospirillum rugosum]